jgi:hypothetical protein
MSPMCTYVVLNAQRRCVMHEDTNDVAPHAATVRLGPELRRKLEDAAKASFRSLNGEIVCRLTKTFRQTDEARA